MSNKKIIKTVDISQKSSLIVTLLDMSSSSEKLEHHLEDIAIENKKRFPNFFGWSKYKKQIDLRQVMRTLVNLKEDGFIEGSNTTSWALTKKGLTIAEKLSDSNFASAKRKIRKKADFYGYEIKRLLNTECFQKYSNEQIEEISPAELKYLFRIDNYNIESFERNINRLYLAAETDKHITNFLDQMVDLVKKYKLDE